MVKNWIKFNESQSNKLSKEMAHEIIYYISEGSEVTELSSHIDSFLNDDFIMYESGHEDMKRMIKKLLSMCQNDPKLNDEMVRIYHKIREEREICPLTYEIEEMLSDFMDLENFNFMIYPNKDEYKIKLSKWSGVTISQFSEYCTEVIKYLDRLKGPDYDTKLVECYFSDYHETCLEFIIRLKSKKK